MFESFLGPKFPPASTAFLSEIEFYIHQNTSFLHTIEKWRNLQISYMGKLAELQSQIKDRLARNTTKSDKVLQQIVQIRQINHKVLINKFNNDIFITNFEACQRIIEEQKDILEIERSLHKEVIVKKEIMDKVMNKKIKLRKNMEEEMMLYIFAEDSMDSNIGKKMKRMGKLKEIMKEQDQYQLKVREVKEIFDGISAKSRENLLRYYNTSSKLNYNKNQIAGKVQLHFSIYTKNICNDFQPTKSMMMNLEELQAIKFTTTNFIEFENQIINRFVNQNTGYLQATLKMIYNKTIDEITQYSKDKEMKKKIKKTLESDCIEPEETDQLTRQIKLVKKILKNKDSSSMTQFKNIVSKNSKYRMNCVFILQMYRLNNKFEISGSQIRPMIILINELLQCHTQNDAFALKQLMVLLMTYFVLYFQDSKQNKIYIVHFFKKHELWRDLELWESILIIQIYLQKKTTIRNLLVSSTTSNRSQLLEAQRTAVLNQILYIVRNMLLFDFCERGVKEFANKFVKILKQDDKFLRDVHRSIEIAVKEEAENRPPQNLQKILYTIINNENDVDHGCQGKNGQKIKSKDQQENDK